MLNEQGWIHMAKQILVHGTTEITDHLAQHCYENTSMTDEVYAPSVGDCLDVSSATNLYKVTLTDPLVSSLNIAHVILFCSHKEQ